MFQTCFDEAQQCHPDPHSGDSYPADAEYPARHFAAGSQNLRHQLKGR